MHIVHLTAFPQAATAAKDNAIAYLEEVRAAC
jgi:hypothetical protein